MIWTLSNRFDPRARELADRHYSRRKPGSPQFVAPGRCLVLFRPGALWVSLDQRFVKHRWPGAWVCALFRNESEYRSSELIREAVAETVRRWGPIPDAGFLTFVDGAKTSSRRSRRHAPGHCFRVAGWTEIARIDGREHGRAELVVLRYR